MDIFQALFNQPAGVEVYDGAGQGQQRGAEEGE